MFNSFIYFRGFTSVFLVTCRCGLHRPGDGWLQKLQVLARINPLLNQLCLSNLKVPGMEPAGNVKWYLWSWIMTFRLAGLENTDVAS